MALKATKGFTDGPAISDIDGRSYSTKDMTDSLVEILEDVFDTDRGLFPADVVSKEFIRDRYQAFRTFRRTADTRTAEMNVSTTDTDIVNRWRLMEGAQGRKADMPMRVHYTQIDIVLKSFLRYTWAL
jgi:hypothetical protein